MSKLGLGLGLTVYGGAGEIGGNKILLTCGETRLFLDFGVSFSAKRRFFGTFLQPHRYSLVRDYVLTGVLPAIRGIYRRDLLQHAAELDDREPSVDAVVVSHAHLDHCGHVSLIRHDIPILLGEGARTIIAAREMSRNSSSIETSILHTGKSSTRIVKTFKTGDVIRVKEIRLEPIHVDHSVPAAYGVIAETAEGVVAYSGDFRIHGPMRSMTRDFIERCAEKGVDTLIIEGTRLDEYEEHSEDNVREALTGHISTSSGRGVVVLVGLLDFDRLRSLLAACEETGRALVISLRHAFLLKQLAEAGLRIDVPKLEHDRLMVYHERRGSGTFSDSDYRGWLSKFIQQLMDVGAPLVRDEEIARSPEKYVLALSQPEDITELANIKPPAGSRFILSTSEPHNEEQMLEMEKIRNWVDFMGMSFHHVHASGHASGGEIINVIEEINPRKIIPIHTEHPGLFAKLLRERGLDTVVCEPRPGETIKI